MRKIEEGGQGARAGEQPQPEDGGGNRIDLEALVERLEVGQCAILTSEKVGLALVEVAGERGVGVWRLGLGRLLAEVRHGELAVSEKEGGGGGIRKIRPATSVVTTNQHRGSKDSQKRKKKMPGTRSVKACQ